MSSCDTLHRRLAIVVLYVVCLEMCLVDISGIYFSFTAQHWRRGQAAVDLILL